jgi:hypothetical protein
VTQSAKAAPWGALDDEDHWWLPPSHVRADLRQFLPSVKWNQIVLLFSLVIFSFVLGELIATILEPIYPPESQEEKIFFGVVLLGSEVVGNIGNIFLAFELWTWTLAFGIGWWWNRGNFIEVLVVALDLYLRIFYFPSHVQVSRCLHLIVCL